MKNVILSVALLALTLSFAQSAFGQSATFASGDSTWTLPSDAFTTDADGVSTLRTGGPGYVSNLSSLTSVPASLGLSGAGWVFSDSSDPGGMVVIADSGPSSGLSLADPFVAYGYYFINTTGTSQPFSMQFTSTFPDTTFAGGSQVDASFGMSLTDGSPPNSSGTSASVMNVTQTAVLGEAAVAGGPLSSSTPLPVTIGPVGITATNGGTQPYSNSLPSTMGPSGGPYNELIVTVSGTYSANADLGVSGRVDAVPEPGTFALGVAGALAGLIFQWRRTAQRAS